MKKEGFFVIGGILIEEARTPWATPLTMPMNLRQDRVPKFFHKKKKKTFKAKLKQLFFQNVKDSSQVT